MGGGVLLKGEENSFIKSFNGKMRDELFEGIIFYSQKETQVLIEM